MQTNLNALSLDKTYSYADYLTWQFAERLELIKGKIFKMAAPSMEHQDISANILTDFGYYLRGKTCKVFAALFDVRLLNLEKSTEHKDVYTVVQPDICVVCDLNKLDKRGCLGTPDLIIEILSPSTAKKDLHEKFHLYQENKVREYWIVSPSYQTIQVFDLNENDTYVLRKAYDRNDSIEAGIFTDLSIDLIHVFPEQKLEDWW